MRGVIHDALKELVLELFGRPTWKKFLEFTNTTEEDYLKLRHYEDEMSIYLIIKSAEHLKVPFDVVLEVYGFYWIKYSIMLGFADMLKSLGPYFNHFLEHMDTVHTLLAVSYLGIIPPYFRSERTADGTILLHYFSARKEGLHMLVVGLIKAAAEQLYNTKLDAKVLKVDEHWVTESESWHHAIIQCTPGAGYEWGPEEKTLIDCSRSVDTPEKGVAVNYQVKFSGGLPQAPKVTADHVVWMFPYEIIFDRTLLVKSVGRHVTRLCSAIKQGVKLDTVTELVYPVMVFTFDNILLFNNNIFILLVPGTAGRKDLRLKGQVFQIDHDHLMFIAGPMLSTLDEVFDSHTYMSDMAIYDGSRQFVQLNQLRQAEINIGLKLEETTAALHIASAALEDEKAKTDALLFELLPREVAEKLRDGIKLDAVSYDDCTIFFSDIVTFTNIAAATTPMHVVNMLNNLYSKFDALTEKHGVYKVETIGDAYVVVSGVPKTCRDHAERLCACSLEMMIKAREVPSPLTGKPLQIRVGLHSGPVMAGVVGVKMPRYCLFGSAVAIANKMESTGKPGKIQISNTTTAHVEKAGFQLMPREEIDLGEFGPFNNSWLGGNPGESYNTLFHPDYNEETGKIQGAKTSGGVACC